MAKRDYEKEITALKDEIADLTGRVKELAMDAVDDTSEVAGEYFEEARDIAGNAWDKTKQAGRTTRQYVEGHPWQGIVTGAAVGFLAGLLIGRKQD